MSNVPSLCLWQVGTLVVGYVLAVAFKWTPSMEGYLRSLSVPVWTAFIFYLGKTLLFWMVNDSVWASCVILYGCQLTHEPNRKTYQLMLIIYKMPNIVCWKIIIDLQCCQWKDANNFFPPVSLTGSWRVPVFVVVVLLLILGSQEKPVVPGKGKETEAPTLIRFTSVLDALWPLVLSSLPLIRRAAWSGSVLCC